MFFVDLKGNATEADLCLKRDKKLCTVSKLKGRKEKERRGIGWYKIIMKGSHSKINSIFKIVLYKQK